MDWDCVKQYTYELQLRNAHMKWVAIDYYTIDGLWYPNQLYYDGEVVPGWSMDRRNRLSHDVMEVDRPDVLPYIQFVNIDETTCQIIAWYPFSIIYNETELLEHIQQAYHVCGACISKQG